MGEPSKEDTVAILDREIEVVQESVKQRGQSYNLMFLWKLESGDALIQLARAGVWSTFSVLPERDWREAFWRNDRSPRVYDQSRYRRKFAPL